MICQRHANLLRQYTGCRYDVWDGHAATRCLQLGMQMRQSQDMAGLSERDYFQVGQLDGDSGPCLIPRAEPAW